MGDVGQEVRRLREARGWSQPKLAVEAGIAVSGVSQIENGKRNPNASTLVKLARALDVEVADFFPKVEAPLWSDSTPEERRTRYLRSWRAFVWKLIQRWEADPPKTSREIAVVLDTMQALIDEGAFQRPPAQVTTSDAGEASEGIELQALFLGLQRLNKIADTVKGDETAQQRRELLKALPGGLSA
jgi:transcriptional regulator with XRE-family HTH domain